MEVSYDLSTCEIIDNNLPLKEVGSHGNMYCASHLINIGIKLKTNSSDRFCEIVVDTGKIDAIENIKLKIYSSERSEV